MYKIKNIIKKKRMLSIFIVGTLCIVSFFTINPTAQSQSNLENYEWLGWWTGSNKITICLKGESVTAKIRMNNEPTGQYRICIMRDKGPLNDIQEAKMEFNYDGGAHTYSLSFTPNTITGGNTNGYYMMVEKKESTWKEVWIMPEYYPPRLRVFNQDDWQWTYYHDCDTINDKIIALGNSNIVNVENIGTSIEGRDILAIKISDNPSYDDEDEPDILLDGLHHAREWISAEVPLYIAMKLIDLYDSDSYIKNLVDNSEIWVIPIVNPDGFVYSQDAIWNSEIMNGCSRFWRKNRRDNGDGSYGVDLNRNYGHSKWGTSTDTGSGDPQSELYWGSSAFSEPETCAIRDLILDVNHNFEAVVSYHNYGQYILYPWAFYDTPTADDSLMNALASEMRDQIYNVYNKQYTVGPSSTTLYKSSGSLNDWLYEAEHIPTFTIELRPGISEGIGFALPAEEILPTCEENWPAALYLIQYTILTNSGFMDFEDGVDEMAISSTIPGMKFTTTMGYDWVYADIRTGNYNVNPYQDSAYECHGNFFAWLGTNQGSGRIDFTGSTAKKVSMLTSTASGLHLEAYDALGTLVDSDYASGNTFTGTMTELSVEAPSIHHIIIHDTGNYWLIDDLKVQDLLRKTTAFRSLGVTAISSTLETTDKDETSEYNFFNDVAQTIKLYLNWEGSIFRLQIIKPDGTTFIDTSSDSPPLRIVIPEAEIGNWQVILTAVDIPYNDYPFALDIFSIPILPDTVPPEINIVLPSIGEAIQDGVTFKTKVIDARSAVDWVTVSIRNPDSETGTLIDPMFESMSSTNSGGDLWQLDFDTIQLPDGYYLFYVEASDIAGNIRYETVIFRITNWAAVELLPSTEDNKAGRTIPVKFSIRIVQNVDPLMPFVRNEELTILIYAEDDPETIVQESTYGDSSTNYRIDSEEEHYILNFKTIKKIPKNYVVEIWRNDIQIGSFQFSTTK